MALTLVGQANEIDSATQGGARMRCLFQRLEGEATSEGLLLVSTVESQPLARCSVKAVGLGRAQDMNELPDHGTVAVIDHIVRWIRPGLIEEYSSSMDGIRQDFVIPEKPRGLGSLWVALSVSGANAEAAGDGMALVLEQTGRRLSYGKLKATDAEGKELAARMTAETDDRIGIVVEDEGAIYPIRIDPTFSDANWVSMGGVAGANKGIRAIAIDTNSGVLYAGGLFTAIGNVLANRVAKWDGSTWSALGSGVNEWIIALAIDGKGNLYAGGYFTSAGGVPAGRIAKWDGSVWSALGAGMTNNVFALAIDGLDNVYAGGLFTHVGDVADTRFIAKWDGSAWSAVGSGMSNSVNVLKFDGSGNLYAGGYFSNAGGVAANCIAKWDGSAWSALGSGMDSYVRALAIDGAGNLYAGGNFTHAGGVAANRVAKWDGSAWSAVGSGMNSIVDTLAADGLGNVYAVGGFTTAGGMSASYIARWDGSAWNAVGVGLNGWSEGLAFDRSGNVYVGGHFTMTGSESAMAIAKWDGRVWSTLGTGMNNYVKVLQADRSGNLYVGGVFTNVNGVAASRIAKWDGSAWSALGSGMNSDVYALATDTTGILYAAGAFTNAGGVTANRIAKWNGSAWSALGSGMKSNVFALTVDIGNNLYAGGAFTNAGGVSARYVAKWNGSVWSAVGSGMSNTVYALAMDGLGNLYAGGTNSGGISASRIAKWNGSTWSALGSGLDATVRALAVDRMNNLYAGGDFATAGGVAASKIAKWDGSAWSALGYGMNSNLYTLRIDGAGNLYAGGKFTTAGGLSAKYIAKWDGSAWSGLGSGMDDVVNALTLDGASNLYAGGAFTITGTNASAYLARAILPPEPRLWVLTTNGHDVANGEAPSASKGTAFGSFPHGQSRTNWYSVTNMGALALSISDVATNGEGASAFQVLNFPPGVAAGAISNFAVSFSPALGQAYTCVVAIANNSSQNPYTLCFSGEGAKWDQSISFDPIADQLSTNRMSLHATASSGLPVSFAVANGPGVIHDGTNLVFTAGGWMSVVATQDGDSDWNPAPVRTNVFRVYGVYTVTVYAVHGTVTKEPDMPFHNEGEEVSLNALADNGYHFTGWAGDAAGVSNPLTLTMNADKAVIANFDLNVITLLTDRASVSVPEGGSTNFQVKLSAQPTGDTVVAVARTAGDADIAVTDGASLTFTPADWNGYQAVTLGAVEDNGDNQDGSATITCSGSGVSNAVVEATEIDDDFVLTVTSLYGTVLADPETPYYDEGTPVTLTASAGPAYYFKGYTGDLADSNNPAILVMDGDKSVTVEYGPNAPGILPPRTIGQKNFTARWKWVEGGAPEGELGVASNAAFTQFVPGYEARYVVNNPEGLVTNLVSGKEYWYRVRRVMPDAVVGPWSVAMKVRTGKGLPVFTRLLSEVPVSKGITQTLALTNLIGEAGTLRVKSSNTNAVRATVSGGVLNLQYLWKATNTARVTMTLTHPTSRYKVSYGTMLRAAAGPVAMVGKSALTNAGTRCAQEVTLENRTGGMIYGVRVRVKGLDNPAWLINRTGQDPVTGLPVVELPCVWPEGSQTVARLVYNKAYKAQAASRPAKYGAWAILTPVGRAGPFERETTIRQQTLYDGLWLLGLPVDRNRLYTVYHSDDEGATWTLDAPTIRATANELMWLDTDDEAPSNRVYRVMDSGL